MIIIISSPKPGTGTTTTAAFLAIAAADDRPTVIVDLGHDQAHLFGVNPHARIINLGDRLELVNAGDLPTAEQADLITPANSAGTHTIVDAGPADHPIHDRLPDDAVTTWVLRPCYLALRRAIQTTRRPDQIIMLAELGRALTMLDIEHTIGVPVVATVEVHPAVARAADAGLLLAGRHPHPVNSLRPLVDTHRSEAS